MVSQFVCFFCALSSSLVQVRGRKSVLTRIGILIKEFPREKIKEIELWRDIIIGND